MLGAAMRRSVFVALALSASCGRRHGKTPSGLESRAGVPTPRRSVYEVRYDQVGYSPDPQLERYGVILSSGRPAAHYRIVEASTKRVVGEGVAGPRLLQVTSRAGTPFTGDRLDLGELPAGAYFVVLDDGMRAGPIRVARDAYAPVLPLFAPFLAEQRCGPTTKSVSLHGACHLFRSLHDGHSGDGVAVHGSAPPPSSRAGPRGEPR